MKSPILRFISKIEQLPTGCWKWTGALHQNGYGHFRLKVAGDYAHRAAYILFRGVIPTELQVDHLCRYRGCVNPYHLELVTTKENINRGIKFGHGAGAFQKAKTHCPQGHVYDEKNTYITKKGFRECKQCWKLENSKRAISTVKGDRPERIRKENKMTGPTLTKVVRIRTGEVVEALVTENGGVWRQGHLTKKGTPPLHRRSDGYLAEGDRLFYLDSWALYDIEQEDKATIIRKQIEAQHQAIEDLEKSPRKLYQREGD